MSISTGLQCCQPWESRVCLCRKPQCLYDTFFDLLNLFLPFWEMFRERHDNTVIHASHMGNYMLHARRSETLQTFTFRLLKGKQRTLVTFQTDGNIPISLHVFTFLLIIQQDIAFIHDAAFLMHVCAFAYVVETFVRNMAHISLWYISTIYSVPLFCYIIIIIMCKKIRFDSCSLYPQNEIGPSISSSVVLCVFVL